MADLWFLSSKEGCTVTLQGDSKTDRFIVVIARNEASLHVSKAMGNEGRSILVLSSADGKEVQKIFPKAASQAFLADEQSATAIKIKQVSFKAFKGFLWKSQRSTEEIRDWLTK